MKVLILGGSGMLGHKLIQRLTNKFEVWATIRKSFADLEKFNVFDKQKTFEKVEAENFIDVKKIIENIKPAVIINAIGVVKQLQEANNVVKTLTLNSIFPHELAKVSLETESRLICISTDCVFKGTKGNYTEEDIPDALDLYGKSKHFGEVAQSNTLTIRTSMIGRELETVHGLVEWFLSQKSGAVKGYTKAIFSGFPTIILADIIVDIIISHQNLEGLYHISSEPINKYELLKLLKNAYHVPIEIEPFADFVIDRSLDSTKFRKETGFVPLEWEDMIEKMANDAMPYDKWRS